MPASSVATRPPMAAQGRAVADHDHEAQVAAYGRCMTCTREAKHRPALDGRQARDEALGRVQGAAPAPWLGAARQAVRDLAATGREWSSDDVWATLPHPPEPRALGAVIRQMAAEGVIESTGRTKPSERPDCHARPVQCWRGVLSAPRHPQAGDNPVDDPQQALL